MMPFVRVLYPECIINLQQDLSYIHDSPVVQECLSRQDDVELIDLNREGPI